MDVAQYIYNICTMKICRFTFYNEFYGTGELVVRNALEMSAGLFPRPHQQARYFP